MGKKKKIKSTEVDYGKSGRETLIEMGLLSTNEDPGKNITMPIRRTKEEYEKDNPFIKSHKPMSPREEHEYRIILAQKMLAQFRWLPWMKSFIDEFGNPKIYTRIRSSGRKKIEIEEEVKIVEKKRQRIKL